MTEVDVQETLINRFNTLNAFSGIQFTSKKNVALPNEKFDIPANKTWFDIAFLSNKPEVISNFDSGLIRIDGYLQIDINTPLGVGEKEANNKYKHIARLFSIGTEINKVLIKNVQRVRSVAQQDHFCTTVRIFFEADIDKE